MIDKKRIESLATLARIHLTPEEVDRLEKDLQKIVAYVDDLKQVKTDGLPEVSQITGITNALRDDEPMPISDDIHQRLLEAMPAKENGYLKVKAVFADEDE